MKTKNFMALMVIMGLAVAIPVFANSIKPSQKVLDFVNIGSPNSEKGHDLQGWGPVEPAKNGGTWGGILTEASCGLDPAINNPAIICDHALRVVYSGNNPAEPDSPTLNGRMASVTFNIKDDDNSAKSINMKVLDGIANDDFVVYIKNKKGNLEQIYTYISNPSTTETWKVINIPLSSSSKPKKSIEVTVMATGSNWAQFDTYGQVGIDWIELVGTGK